MSEPISTAGYCTRVLRTLSWSGLLLSRTMIIGVSPIYVDRFACDWPRFSTTDPNTSFSDYYKLIRAKMQLFSLIFMY